MVRHCPRKICAAPSAYMPLCHTVNLPSSVARRPLCHKVNLPSSEARRPLCHEVNLPSSVARRPLCHKVNLPRYEARRRHLIMTCDIAIAPYGAKLQNTRPIYLHKNNLYCILVRSSKNAAYGKQWGRVFCNCSQTVFSS